MAAVPYSHPAQASSPTGHLSALAARPPGSPAGGPCIPGMISAPWPCSGMAAQPSQGFSQPVTPVSAGPLQGPDGFMANSVASPSPMDYGFSPMQAPTPPPATTQGPNVLERLRLQVEYYFSDENLNRDAYLRKRMSSEGYVNLLIISGFARIRSLTPLNDGGSGVTTLLLQAISSSPVLEVDASRTKVRRKEGWEQYLTQEGSTRSPG